MELSDRTRGNGHKLKHKWFPLNIRKYFWAARVIEHWNTFAHTEVTVSPSLEIIKNKTERSPEQPGVVNPALSWEVGFDALLGSVCMIP